MKPFAIIAILAAIAYFWYKHSQTVVSRPAGSNSCPPVGPLTTQQAALCPDDPRAIFAGSGIPDYFPAPSPTQREAPQYSATFDQPAYQPAFMDFGLYPGAVEA